MNVHMNMPWPRKLSVLLMKLGVTSIKGTCPPGYTATTNTYCCPTENVEKHSYKDPLDMFGESQCPLSRAGCGKELISGRDEAYLCPQTCGFCAPHGTCADLMMPLVKDQNYCKGKENECKSNDEVTKKYMKKQCPKTCGYCQ